MSLSEELGNELAAIEPDRACDRLAELSALFHSAGSFHLRAGGDVSLELDLGRPAAARRAFSLLRAVGVRSEIRTYRRRAFDRATRFELHATMRSDAGRVLHAAGVLTARLAPLARPPRRVVGRACCRRAYLRGALLARSTLTGPRAAQLELRTATREAAEFVRDVAAAEGVALAVQERRGHAAAYTKSADAISELLVAAGAGAVALRLQEEAVIAATRSRANRLANADHANVSRASRAAHAQTEAVRRLQLAGELAKLPRPLREIAELRLRHPSLSLRELALKARPPTTKVTVHRRLRRLQELAER